jgi:hypothetical protein
MKEDYESNPLFLGRILAKRSPDLRVWAKDPHRNVWP